MADKPQKHSQLTIFEPNNLFINKLHHSALPVKIPYSLIRAKLQFENLVARKIFNEILSQDHAREPQKLIYTIDYKLLASIKDDNIRKNGSKIELTIAKYLNAFPIKLTEEDYKKLGIQSKKGNTYIFPFPTVSFQNKELKIDLHPDFKTVLIQAKFDYLGAELSLLRSLTSEPANLLYLEIREAQRSGKNTITFSLDDLKKILGLEGKYEGRMDHFKTKVLDKIRAEFLNKWVEFEYKLIKSGKGGAVTGIEFNFKPDEELVKELERNLSREWQKQLYWRYKFPIGKIQIITDNIYRSRQIILDASLSWSEIYVEETLRLSQVRFYSSHYLKKPSVENESGYIYTALFEGTFIPVVEQIIIRKLPQLKLGAIQEQPKEQIRKRVGEPILISEIKEYCWDKKGSFEDFIKRAGYVIEGNYLIKYE